MSRREVEILPTQWIADESKRPEPNLPVEEARMSYPDPTPEMLNGDPLFDAIWLAIKGWDISRHNDGLYSGPTGNDARHIYDAIRATPIPDTSAGEREMVQQSALGTFACPICGQAEPHYHSQEDRQGAVAVAWLCEIAQVATCNEGGNVWSDWRPSLTFNRPAVPEGSIKNLRPLYAGPVNAHEIHRAMLTRIAQLMDSTECTPRAHELSALAAACEAYEEEIEPWTGSVAKAVAETHRTATDHTSLVSGAPSDPPSSAGERMREALGFYADPFAWKQKHDPEDTVRVPDFYSETSFGDTAAEALAALSLQGPSGKTPGAVNE